MFQELSELALIFLRLGATSFGGPLAHIALMRQEFVERRQWLSEQEFLDLNGAVNLIPGPNSTELAMHIGHRRAGNAGLWTAGACFIAPAMFMVLALAWAYKQYGTLPASRAILWGVAPVVVAIVAQALSKFAPSALKTWMMRLIAMAVILAMGLGCSEIALIFAAAGLGLVLALRTPAPEPEKDSEVETGTKPTPRGAFLLLVPAVAPSVLGVFLSFLKMGFVVYGSGYVLLAYLRSELVEGLHWITDRQLLDAVAVGQVTPGPVFTTATFLGYQIAGVPGAFAATAGIFGPSFVMVGILASVLNRHAGSPKLRVFLDCVNAASFALMLAVTVQLAYASLFPGGRMDWVACLIGVVSLGILLKTKVNSAVLLAAGAAIGLFLGRGV